MTISQNTGKCIRIELQRFYCLHDSVLPSGSHWNVGVAFSGEHAGMRFTHEAAKKSKFVLIEDI